MPNIILQDVMLYVNGTSRFNNNAFDTVLVKTTIKADAPIVDEYYVPSGVTANERLIQLLELEGLEVTPFRASTLLSGTEDIAVQAQNGNPAETLADAAKLLLLSILKKSTLVPVAGSRDLYELTYEYKIFPLTSQGLPNSYELKIRVPFDGLTLIPGGNNRVEVTTILPRGAVVDTNATKGIDENGVELQELVVNADNVKRQIVTFEYHIDPLFTVRYDHTLPITD